MKETIFKGCGTAIATPFTEDGVNFEEFGKLLEEQVKEGVDAIIVCGTTGESSTMSEQERKETIKFAIEKVGKRVKVIAGTGSNNTKEDEPEIEIHKTQKTKEVSLKQVKTLPVTGM